MDLISPSLRARGLNPFNKRVVFGLRRFLNQKKIFESRKLMQFDILTIFPYIFTSYLNESILKRAQKERLIKINIHNIRDYTLDKHKKVDDRPYGGGAGMVFTLEPIYRALRALKIKNQKSPKENKFATGQAKIKMILRSRISLRETNQKSKVILLSPRGKLFNQRIAKRFSKLNQIILICGRYEGVDERVKKFIDEEVSIGNYILSGGEAAAMVIVEAVTRLVPGVLGNLESLKDLGYPVYTRPENFKGMKVPEVLLSGDHKKIQEWRKEKLRLQREK